jgi:hypothetical protein
LSTVRSMTTRRVEDGNAETFQPVHRIHAKDDLLE